VTEFMDYGDPSAMRAYIPELEAEVKRLRAHLEREQGLTKWAADAAAAGQAEAERLRAVEKWAKRICKPGRDYRRDEDIEELRRALEGEK